MKKTVVFDFDGTLIREDSLSEVFYSATSGNKILLRCAYYLLKVLSKFKIISVKREKELAIDMIFDNNFPAFSECCKRVCGTLHPTKWMELLKEYKDRGYQVIVLSASPEILLNYFFREDDVEIIGAKLSISEEGRIERISSHPYGEEKVTALRVHGYTSVDECYFDSRSDRCLETLCKSCFQVVN